MGTRPVDCVGDNRTAHKATIETKGFDDVPMGKQKNGTKTRVVTRGGDGCDK